MLVVIQIHLKFNTSYFPKILCDLTVPKGKPRPEINQTWLLYKDGLEAGLSCKRELEKKYYKILAAS